MASESMRRTLTRPNHAMQWEYVHHWSLSRPLQLEIPTNQVDLKTSGVISCLNDIVMGAR